VTSAEVRSIVEHEIGDNWSQSNAHQVNFRKCLVQPKKVPCRNTFPQLNGGNPLDLWIVLEETPGKRDGYLIVYDERQCEFGLAVWDGDTPVFIGFYGDLLTTLFRM
jgi:hypothetical protein